MLTKAKLPVQIFKQGRRFVAYTPLLDLSTSGRSEKEAKLRFHELVQIFFEELEQAGTVNEVLRSLGWQKVKSQWQPPKIIANESMSVSIPAIAWILCRRLIKSVGENLKNFS